MSEAKSVNILLVEDDEIDVKAFKRAFSKLNITNPLHVESDGVHAFEYLERCMNEKLDETPNLLILDINMPRMNGLELLKKIRADERMRSLIVFMLTTSNDERDKFEAYDLNVAGYMLKTDMGSGFQRAIELVDNYWRVIEFPERGYISNVA
jgi:CheY-like chemotaxis protein